MNIENKCVKKTFPDLGGELNKNICSIAISLYQKSEFFAKMYDAGNNNKKAKKIVSTFLAHDLFVLFIRFWVFSQQSTRYVFR